MAEKVLTDSPHCLIVGEGAKRFAEKHGFPKVGRDKLVSEKAVKALEKFRHKENVTNEIDQDDGTHGTVGAVAIDSKGNLAAATSTGGRTGQLVGRVGDTPIIGAGVYADNHRGTQETSRVTSTNRANTFNGRACMFFRCLLYHRDRRVPDEVSFGQEHG